MGQISDFKMDRISITERDTHCRINILNIEYLKGESQDLWVSVDVVYKLQAKTVCMKLNFVASNTTPAKCRSRDKPNIGQNLV